MILSINFINFILYLEILIFSDISIRFIRFQIIKESSTFNILHWVKLRKKDAYVLWFMTKVRYKSKLLTEE